MEIWDTLLFISPLFCPGVSDISFTFPARLTVKVQRFLFLPRVVQYFVMCSFTEKSSTLLYDLQNNAILQAKAQV